MLTQTNASFPVLLWSRDINNCQTVRKCELLSKAIPIIVSNVFKKYNHQLTMLEAYLENHQCR